MRMNDKSVETRVSLRTFNVKARINLYFENQGTFAFFDVHWKKARDYIIKYYIKFNVYYYMQVKKLNCRINIRDI